jgi:polysaccharide pyruvyl transferase WcaK-like protein
VNQLDDSTGEAQPRRVVLLNAYSSHNLGDALLIENSVEAIRRIRPGAEIVAMATDAASFQGRLEHATVIPSPISSPRDMVSLPWALLAIISGGRLGSRRLRSLREVHEAFSVGGGFLQFRRLRELITIVSVHVIQLGMCKRLGVPITMFPQSVGPFGGRLTTSLGRWILGWFQLILVREQRSADYVTRIAPELTGRVRLAPDLALLSPGRPIEEPPTPPRVGIVVRQWWFPAHQDPAGAFDRYVDAVAGLISWLRTNGSPVELAIQSNGPLHRGDDRIAARAVVERLGAPVEIVDLDLRESANAAISRYGRYDVLVATRMHAALMGLLAGTPTIAIAYEAKTPGVFQMLGLTEWVVDIVDLAAEALIDRVVALPRYPCADATAAIRRQRDRLLEILDAV